MVKKMTVTRESGALEISYNWRMRGLWFLVVFGIIWNLSILGAIVSGAGFFISFHALAGVAITYLILTRFLNRTTISVTRSQLAVTHGPLPWPFAKNLDVTTGSLRQLSVRKSSVEVNGQPTYHLVGKLDTGAEVKIIRSGTDRDFLRKIERLVENHLNITDDPQATTAEDKLDLETFREQMETLEPLKNWLPKSVRNRVEEAQAKFEQAHVPPADDRTASSSGTPPATDAPRWTATGTTPRPLPDSPHDFDYAIYRVNTGAAVTLRDVPHRVGRTAQLDFSEEADFGRQLELIPTGGGAPVYVYGQTERARWAYYEERRLDDEEVRLLGFTGNSHPRRFENGEDRYYPRDRQTGTRYFAGGNGQAFEQYIYFSTGSVTQFRSLHPAGSPWEVYVMEPVDGSAFDA